MVRKIIFLSASVALLLHSQTMAGCAIGNRHLRAALCPNYFGNRGHGREDLLKCLASVSDVNKQKEQN
jgi:hypothetical protein